MFHPKTILMLYDVPHGRVKKLVLSEDVFEEALKDTTSPSHRI